MKKNEKKLACLKSFSYISTVIERGCSPMLNPKKQKL